MIEDHEAGVETGRRRTELGLFVSTLTAIMFLVFGAAWMSDLSNLFVTGLLFAWIFLAMIWAAFGVVGHAESLAVLLGEPFGTLILTLSVISIEVVMISAVMLTGSKNPELGRDMMFAVLMIVLNGLVGVCLFFGGLRHVEQEHNLQGANTFLAVLMPLSVLSLILPNYTVSSEYGTLSTVQMGLASAGTLALYGAFLGIQTMRHQGYFVSPADAEAAQNPHDPDIDHADIDVRSVPFHVMLLVAYMIPIVLLSKKLAVIVDFGIERASAPAVLGGVLVAIVVLSPEALAAVRSALDNRLQRSINICLGSALATIGLTVPAILAIGLYTGQKVTLGLGPVDSLLLILTLGVSVVNFSSVRTNLIHGLVPLILFATWFAMIFD